MTAAADAKFEPLRTSSAGGPGNPWPQPLASDFARYFRDGNRTAYEDLVSERQSRLSRAVVMALANEHDGEACLLWVDEVADGVTLLCEQSTWCWGAHEDVHKRQRHVVPNIDRPYLDLGAGEVVAQLGWIDLVLGEKLDARIPGLRERMRAEVGRRVIAPFLDRDDWPWLGLDGDVHNWNPWIHSNLLVAAVTLVDDARLQSRVVALAIEGLDRFMASLPDDGAIDEGFSYWWNGAGRALEALAFLEQATAGALAVDGIPAVHAVLDFPHSMHLGGNWYLNVADGPALAHNDLPWDMVQTWARRLGHAEAAQHADAQWGKPLHGSLYLGRVLRALMTASHRETQMTSGAALVQQSYLPSVQILVARQNTGSVEGLLLAVKGGHNGENHNHHDVGSVVVAVDGVPLLVDAGQPTYTARTFGPDRYDEQCMQSLWHNAPAPWGQEQQTGVSFAAELVQSPVSEDPTMVLELAGAYNLPSGASWQRSASLDRTAGVVVVEDAWDLGEQQGPASSVNYLAAGTVVLDAAAGSATIHPNGIPGHGLAQESEQRGERGLRLVWNPNAAVVHQDSWQLSDPLLQRSWGDTLTRMRFEFPADSTRGEFSISMEVSDDHE
ncbi:heparinase [Arthrobacter alpinus]|nr:heparinase [Arthrobacter alpinus]